MKNNIILKITSLEAAYAEQKIIDQLSLEVTRGEILMLVGANGAGKSTLLKAIFGLLPKIKGEIELDHEKITPCPWRMAQMGIAFVPQTLRIFPEMTVEENLHLGGYIYSDKKLIKTRLQEIYELFPMLKKNSSKAACTLSGGQRQMLALGRSLMIRPKLLLLDEPSVGLAPKIITEIFQKIQEIRKTFDTTIIIVEHNLKSLLKIADRALIMANGQIIKEGKPQELLHSRILEEVFFGQLA